MCLLDIWHVVQWQSLQKYPIMHLLQLCLNNTDSYVHRTVRLWDYNRYTLDKLVCIICSCLKEEKTQLSPARVCQCARGSICLFFCVCQCVWVSGVLLLLINTTSVFSPLCRARQHNWCFLSRFACYYYVGLWCCGTTLAGYKRLLNAWKSY